ncbi:hypothetical protein CSOJ01_03849 [Colletotrichum sojae]|uniref:RBR-type E3 ubiquitin transferase n=1 Tax=Colletotrichum sojae TaxID=2175907 RepID=A0A8H6JLM7_9PEZI|nr:hypothetical protein CSOJ01_03849 [Colletotrichum sojae]
MATSYHNPNLPAALNDYDLRHVDGGSVVFGSGGEVVSFKLIDDYSAIRIDGLGPHEFNPATVNKILAGLGVSGNVAVRPEDDDVAYTRYIVVRFEGREVAKTILARFNALSFAQRQRAGMLYVKLTELALGIDDVDPVVPPALTPPICRPRYRGQCTICTDDLDEERFVGACGHSYCLDCFTAWVQFPDAFAQEGVLVCDRECRSHLCNYEFSLAELKDQLPSAAYETLLRNSAEEYVKQRPHQFRHCPHAGCGQLYRPTRNPAAIQCTGCNGTICTSCGEPHDERSSCKRDAQLEEAKTAMGAKDCPACKASMVKSHGCNHMTCQACRTHICWVCMATFDTGDECYKHMRLVHGSYDGVTMIDADGNPVLTEEEMEEELAWWAQWEEDHEA